MKLISIAKTIHSESDSLVFDGTLVTIVPLGGLETQRFRLFKGSKILLGTGNQPFLPKPATAAVRMFGFMARTCGVAVFARCSV